jgi:hypothetical protein
MYQEIKIANRHQIEIEQQVQVQANPRGSPRKEYLKVSHLPLPLAELTANHILN